MKELLAKQLNELAGKRWEHRGQTFYFVPMDDPRRPPWHSGQDGLGAIYPLLDESRKPTAYLKIMDGWKCSQKHIERARWLIEQRVDLWAPELRGAPWDWVDTRESQRPDEIGFDFRGQISMAVPGESWARIKWNVAKEELSLDDEFRQQCVHSLLKALLFLERNDFVHGDLSPENVIIDIRNPSQQSVLSLIDFDSFCAPQAGDLAGLSAAEDGTIGTDGYIPPKLDRISEVDPAQAIPDSDRYARDMLLLEFLVWTPSIAHFAPPLMWDPKVLRSNLQQTPLSEPFRYLAQDDIFDCSEENRPSSEDLAESLGLPLPPRIKKAKVYLRPGQSRTSHVFQRLEVGLRDLIDALWLFCVFLLGVVVIQGATRMGFAADPSANWLQITLRFLGQVGLSLSVFGAGATFLAYFAFAERVVCRKSFYFFALEIPARRDAHRGELARAALVITVLFALLLILGIASLTFMILSA